MDSASGSITNMFNVDLLALTWIAVAIVVVTTLAWHFYHGLSLEDHSAPPKNPLPMSVQQRWLMFFVVIWWSLDTLWHSRSIVVTPTFWRPIIEESLHHLTPALALMIHWWSANPILWDFSVLVTNTTLVVLMALSWAHPSRFLLMLAVIWGLVRWGIDGFSTAFGGSIPFGPGGYLWVAAAAYLILFPHHHRALLMSLCGILAIDALRTTDLGHEMALHIEVAIGLFSMVWGLWRRWTLSIFRVLVGFITVDAIFGHMGTHFYQLGMNHLWEPGLLVLGLGLNLNAHRTPTTNPLGG